MLPCLKIFQRNKFSNIRTLSLSTNTPNIAVVLSGCGVFDGSEIHESVAVLSHITRNNANPTCFAPNTKQFHVINHSAGQPDETSSRNVLEESSRIQRSPVLPLTELLKNIKTYQAVVFPGGFGAAKNLSDFAFNGVQCKVLPEVEEILKTFHEAKKPIALCCIAPILAAKVLPNITITLGKDSGDKWPYKDAIKAAQEMGAKIELKDCHEVTFDFENKILTTPAFMYEGKYHEIDDGIGNMIQLLIKTIK